MTLIYIGLVLLAIFCVITGIALARLAKSQDSDYKFLIKYTDSLKYDCFDHTVLVGEYAERLEERIEKLEQSEK